MEPSWQSISATTNAWAAPPHFLSKILIVSFNFCEGKKMLWTCAWMYLYARRPLAGGPQGQCTYTNLRQRLAPAL
jgi:hypothetical protein